MPTKNGANADVELRIDLARPYEAGALLHAVVACGVGIEDRRCASVFSSLCAKALRLAYELKPGDETPITARPQHLFRDPTLVNREFQFASRRIGDRLVAGRMAVPYFRRAVNGDDAVNLPKSVKRLSVNQMAEFVLEDAGQADADNVEKRQWRPSLPVIHLCAAMAVIRQRVIKAAGPLPLVWFLFDPDFVASVAREAEGYMACIEKDSKFPVRPEKMLRVRLV